MKIPSALAVFVVVTGLAGAAGDLVTMTTEIRSTEVKGPPLVSNVISVIHNASTVPVTAWIVAQRDRRGLDARMFAYTVRDSVFEGFVRAVEPGGQQKVQLSRQGDPEKSEYSTVSGLFEDGSAFGDKVWAAVVWRRRKLAYEVIQSAINELQQAKGKSRNEALDMVSLSWQRQQDTYRAKLTAIMDYADQLGRNRPMRDMFFENDNALKRANADWVVGAEHIHLLSPYYLETKGYLTNVPVGESTDQAIGREIDHLQGIIAKILSSRPGILGPGPDQD